MTALSEPRVSRAGAPECTALGNTGFSDFEPSVGCLYLYEGGNPINRVDPLGLQAQAATAATQPASSFSGLGKVGTIKIGEDTIEFSVDKVNMPIDRAGNKDDWMRINVSSATLACDAKDKVRILQFVHRVVHGPHANDGIPFEGIGGAQVPYPPTTDPKNPQYHTDNHDAGSPFASAPGKNIMLNAGPPHSFQFFDSPTSGGFPGKQEAIYDAFIEIGGKIVYHIQWERDFDEKGNPLNYAPPIGEPAGGLPDWATKTLTKEGLKY